MHFTFTRERGEKAYRSQLARMIEILKRPIGTKPKLPRFFSSFFHLLGDLIAEWKKN